MPTAAEVQVLADAYRGAMADADEALADNALERKLLHAMVAASAEDSSRWIQTRAPGGPLVARPLEELAAALQQGNVVGQGLTIARRRLLAEAKSLARSVVGPDSWPWWVGAIAAFFGGLAGFAYEAGSISTQVILGLLGLGVPAIFFLRAAQAVGPAVQAGGDYVGSLLDRADSIGRRAERVFIARIGDLLSQVAPGSQTGSNPAQQVRGGAKAFVLFAYVTLAVALVFFASGVADAVQGQQTT